MTAADFTKALQKTDEIELTVTGRVSGKKSTRPVWFVLEGKTLYLLPVQGSDSEWYRNVLKHPEVTLAVEGAKWTGKAAPITDPAKVHDVVESFRTKYGAGEVKKYYTKLDVAGKVPLK
jgi:deazaflavin-dependent oxidoreductase (nitroreductase family)